jgi:multiple sugar transport system permease protein
MTVAPEPIQAPRAGDRPETVTAVAAPTAPRRRQILLWIAVVLIIIFCLFPFYWLINTSLKTGADLSSARLLPPRPTLANYESIFGNADFVKALRNSAIVSISTTVIALVIGSFAAYALARLRFSRKFLLLALILSISTFPPIAVAAPVFKLWTDIGLYNTYIGLILPSLIREIPRELEEAALVDTATHFQAFRKVIVPLAAPGLVTAGLLTFIFVWNEFLFAITLTSTPDVRTVPAAIQFFTGSQRFEIPLGTISAASVIVTIPLILIVVLFQRRIVAGLTAGAVKG